AFLGRGARPALECLAGRRHRLGHLCPARLRGPPDDLLRRRVDHVVVAVVRRHPLPADEQPLAAGRLAAARRRAPRRAHRVLTVLVSRPERSTVPGTAPVTAASRMVSTPLTRTLTTPRARESSRGLSPARSCT